jgi:hypothetical protein
MAAAILKQMKNATREKEVLKCKIIVKSSNHFYRKIDNTILKIVVDNKNQTLLPPVKNK